MDDEARGDVTYEILVLAGEQQIRLQAPHNANLRQVLLSAGISPYSRFTRRLNCGGRGLCATCGVWIEDHQPAPNHWHDRLGSRFGYPRLSCQITIQEAMTIRLLTDKWIWGSPDSAYRVRPEGDQP